MELEAKYQNPYTCNKCRGENSVSSNLREGESKTKCKGCGFDDFWAYGFFESSQEMVGNAKTYTRKTCPF